jgi:hypothetical protein
MKKQLLTLLLAITSITLFAQTPKTDGTQIHVDHTKEAASAISKVTTTVSNAIDSGKQAVKEGVQFIDTSSNFKRIYSDAKAGILGLASALKVGAEHVYMVIVKQQVVNAIVWIAVAAVLVFIPLFYEKRLRKWAAEGASDSDGGIWFLYVVGAILPMFIGFLILIFNMNTIIMGFVNPEYGAIKDIIDFVR